MGSNRIAIAQMNLTTGTSPSLLDTGFPNTPKRTIWGVNGFVKVKMFQVHNYSLAVDPITAFLNRLTLRILLRVSTLHIDLGM